MSESNRIGCYPVLLGLVIFLCLIALIVGSLDAIDTRLDRLEKRAGIVSCDEAPVGILKLTSPIAERLIEECPPE